MPLASRTFFQSLESLRGIAALMVVIYHVGWINPFYDIAVIRNGALMVDLFFVLSGFVMVHCYGNKFDGYGSFYAFLRARFWRLYPLHFLMLLVFLWIELAKYIAEVKLNIISANPAFSRSNLTSFSYHLLLIHSLVQDHGSFNTPSWSISTEFYTYIIFAMIMVISKAKRFLYHIFFVVAGLSFLAILMTGHTSLTFDYQDSLFRCLYGFFIGAFIHGIYQKYSVISFSKRRENIGIIILLIVLTMFAYILGIKHDNYIEFFMPPLVAFLILLLTILPDNIFSKALCWQPFLWLGKVSYSIYMVHMAFIWGFSALLQAVFGLQKTVVEGGDSIIDTSLFTGSLLVFLLVICVLCASHFSFKYIEDPFRKLAKRNSVVLKVTIEKDTDSGKQK